MKQRVKLAIVGLVLLLAGVVVIPSSGSAKSLAQRKVLRLQAVKVEGRAQKPQTFFVLRRSALRYDERDLAPEVLPQVLQSIAAQPF